jgi:hypothetical protein
MWALLVGTLLRVSTRSQTGRRAMYLDPSGNKAGASLDSILGAAADGALTVDPQTGEATLKFLSDIQDLVDKMALDVKQISVVTPLGGGFGEEIGKFNQALAAGGPNSAQESLTRFSQELTRLREAVTMSMKSYHAVDSGNAHNLSNAAGPSR